MVKIGGLQKSSLIDYSGKISSIVFTQGCNFRCPYCHNPELINTSKDEKFNVSSILDFLKTRIHKLDAVVITGGEPTIHKNLPDFITEIKKMGFLVKLDTNGTNPSMLKDLIEQGLLDYVAMDVKAPLRKYSQVVGVELDTANIKESALTLINSEVPYEFRTTVVKSQIDPHDFNSIATMIKGADKYYIQRFLPTKTLDSSFINQETYTDEEFWDIVTMMPNHIKKVELR